MGPKLTIISTHSTLDTKLCVLILKGKLVIKTRLHAYDNVLTLGSLDKRESKRLKSQL